MNVDIDTSVRRRRRGKQLEVEILEAAWEELVDVGFHNLTMESVAVRAKTGIAVLYRRWPNKDELVCEALSHARQSIQVEAPDTGTLRDDLIKLLNLIGRDLFAFFIVMTKAIASGLQERNGLTPAEVRDRILGQERKNFTSIVFQNAHERGEINLENIPSHILTLPLDLGRHDLLMGLKPLSKGRIEIIVDDIFLPLLSTFAKRDKA